MMNDTDISDNGYVNRCRDEYEQLCMRLEKLDSMLCKYRSGTLDFTPNCSFEALSRQADAMREYKEALEHRNAIEHMW